MLAEKFNNHFPNAKQKVRSYLWGMLCVEIKKKKNCVFQVPNQDQKGFNCDPEQLNIEIYNL